MAWIMSQDTVEGQGEFDGEQPVPAVMHIQLEGPDKNGTDVDTCVLHLEDPATRDYSTIRLDNEQRWYLIESLLRLDGPTQLFHSDFTDRVYCVPAWTPGDKPGAYVAEVKFDITEQFKALTSKLHSEGMTKIIGES